MFPDDFPPVPPEGFVLVIFDGPDDGNPTYPQYAPWQYKYHDRTDDLDVNAFGLPGQHTHNPCPHEKLFNLHYIVHVGTGTAYYDPSYGVTTTDPSTYTSAAVGVWGERRPTPPLGNDLMWRTTNADSSVLPFTS